jgi:gliding motility-associated-like protein
MAGMFLQQEGIFAQVITNFGANINITPGTVVESKDLDNSVDSVGNNGTINLSGNFYNAGPAVTYGSGQYNVKGNWDDFGEFSEDSSTVTFSGSGIQTITQVSNGETFFNLNVNKSSGVATHVGLNPGNTLVVLRNLNIGGGTLRLGDSTALLKVSGGANIAGILLYNNSRTQVASISGNLSGTGIINMNSGSHPHLLNLTGESNQIGTLLTASGSSSKVDYLGADQTVFASPNYRNLNISTSGTKTLQGTSVVGKDLTVSAGVFDFGLADSLEVDSLTKIAGAFKYNSGRTQTALLRGDMSGLGLIDMSAGNRSHFLKLEGVNNSILSFTSGTGSTVDYVRNGDQNIFTSGNYYNLKISGSGTKILNSDISASGQLVMRSGNINSQANTLKILNADLAAVDRTAGTVIGKLQRKINSTSDHYLYPIGSDTSYNPMKIRFRELSSAGDLIAQFKLGDIGNITTPLEDLDGNEIWDRFTQGYWRLTAQGLVTTRYDVNLNYDRFEVVDPSSRIVKRSDNGDFELDGKGDDNSLDSTNHEIRRDSLVNGISSVLWTDLGIGKGRPKIKEQPIDTSVCEGSAAFFEVRSTRFGKVRYQWEIRIGGVWKLLEDTSIYSGTKTRRLVLSTTDTLLTGNRYRVVLMDKWGNVNVSNTVKLTVNKIPKATATPVSQIVCDNEQITPVILRTSNYVSGTTFRWERNSPDGIIPHIASTGFGLNIGDPISGSFENTTLDSILVEFTVYPTGPLTTYCEGDPIKFTVIINPIPRISVNLALEADTVICNGETPGIEVSSPMGALSGIWNYNLTVSSDPQVTGAVGNETNVSVIPNAYANTLTNDDTFIREVRYLFKPNIYNSDGTPNTSCPSVDTTLLIKVTPTLLSTAKPDTFIGGRNISCFKLSDGRIDISPKGGYYVKPYSFEWSKGNNVFSKDEDPAGLNIGKYHYNVTDKIGCYFEDSVILTQPDTLRAAATRIDSVSCTGATNGAVYIDVSGGSKAYSFAWKSPGTIPNPSGRTYNEDLTEARFGIHNLKIKDANNCSFDTSFIILIADPMTVTEAIPLWGNFPIKCNGDSTGTIKVYADGNGAKEAYRYYWTKTQDNSEFPDTASALFKLNAGEYRLTVIDEWGCEGYGVYNLIEPNPIRVKRTNPLYAGDFDISCPGLKDGVITNTVSGGHTSNKPVNYLWTMKEDPMFNATTRDIKDLAAGNYRLGITDAFTCKGDTFFQLQQPDDMFLADTLISDYNGYEISCHSFNNGSIDLTLAGGFSPVKDYLWYRENNMNPFSDTEDLNNLTAGKYHLEVRDKITNCPAAWDFELIQPDTINLTLSNINKNGYEISCFNSSDGNIDLNLTGGVPPFSFAWSNEYVSGFSSVSQNIADLKTGIYSVEVRDSNSCIVTRTDTLHQPEKLTTGIIPKTISCFSTNNGAADLTVAGGVENTYTYLWSNGRTEQDLDSLFTGKYYVRVLDANNCEISDTTFVTEPPEIIISMNVLLPENYNGRMISCYGQSDATVKSKVYGGVPYPGEVYQYDWKHKESSYIHSGENDSIVSSVAAGNYILTITDGNLCKKLDSITVEQPFKLSAEVYETNPTCDQKNNGQITLIVQGGTPTYDINWFTIGQKGQTADSIGAGRFDVLITDLNNCTLTTYGKLVYPDSITFGISKLDPKCPDTPDGELHYFNIKGGTQPYDLRLYNLTILNDSTLLGEGTEKSVTDLFEGKYRIKITDNNQCAHSDTTILKGDSPLCIDAPNAFSPNGDGTNDTWVINHIDLYPEVKVEIYNRWGELVFYAPKGYNEPWDGTFKGRELPIGSYFYVFDLNPNGNPKYKGTTEITGDITIVR